MNSAKKRCLLVIWLDAFRADYLDAERTPFLHRLSSAGITALYRPTLSFVGIGVSMFTGVNASVHGCWTEFYYDPSYSPFKWTAALSPFCNLFDVFCSNAGKVGDYARMAGNLIVYTLSNSLYSRSYRPIALHVPLSVLHLLGLSVSENQLSSIGAFPIPTLFDILRERGVPFRVLEESLMHDDKIVREALHVDDNNRLVFIQIAALDRFGHRDGPDSNSIKRAVSAVDSWVAAIVEAHNKIYNVDVLLVADHGMIKINNTVDILGQFDQSGLKYGQDYIAFLDSTMARFWLLKPSCRNIVIDKLVSIKCGKILDELDLKKYNAPLDKRYGEIIWLANPGTVILPNYYQGRKTPRGMHGYAPESEGLSSRLVIFGKNFTQRNITWCTGPIDVFVTILKLLDLPIPEYVKGKSLV